MLQLQSSESRTNSEADTPSSGRNPKSVDMQDLIHRYEPNRPHISSVYSNFKERGPQFPKTRETKSTRSANLLWRNLRHIPQCFLPADPPKRCSILPSGVPLCASAPPVKGYLRFTPNTRNPKKQSFLTFFTKISKCKQFQ